VHPSSCNEHLFIYTEHLLTQRINMKYRFWCIGIVTLVLAAGPLFGQAVGDGITAAVALPDSPSPATSGNQAAGLVDLRSSVNSGYGRDDAACASFEPCNARLNFGEKFRYFAHRSFGAGAFFSPLFTAGPGMANAHAHYPKQWRQGAAAFGRLYGDALAFQTAAQTSRFLTGAALHEDPRYSRSTIHNPLIRTMHAIVFTAFDKSDSGHTTLALSNFVGAASAGFVGNAYLPRGYNDTSHAVTRTGIAFGSFAFTNLTVEFSPELRRIGRGLHLPKFLLSGQARKGTESR
jgi:hypothetical protein